MSRGLRQRIQKLEGGLGNQAIPNVIVATCPIPDSDLPLCTASIERWLESGVAHVAFKGHAVFYDGGRRHPLTIEQWQALYCGP
jgi:hypothetical protein